VLGPDTGHPDDVRTTLDRLVGPGQRVDDVLVWDVRPLIR
jgi:hypothetical protein